ncbi:MAG: PadR family transcriptional regulator [Candidatus Bathyarchaeota archaeon]|nr:PadR family transcriptional regulator [Candidatus Bathyarchaeota archaeon]
MTVTLVPSGLWIPYVGTIYHCLRRLEKKGLVKSSVEYREKGLDRRNYTITERGTEAVGRGIEYFRNK